MNKDNDKIMTPQEKEIATIKERTISLKLSEADCERISERAGMSGLTVSELLENFIGDLVGGTFTNGSDEVDKANEWFDRCWFSYKWDEEKNLLGHLLEWGHDVDDFLRTIDEQEYYKEHPEEFADEIAELEDGEKIWFERDIEEVTKEYIEQNPKADMVEEIKICRQYLKDLNSLKGAL